MGNVIKRAVIISLFAVAFLSWMVSAATPGDQICIIAVAGISGGLGILLALFWDRIVLLIDVLIHKERRQ